MICGVHDVKVTQLCRFIGERGHAGRLHILLTLLTGHVFLTAHTQGLHLF